MNMVKGTACGLCGGTIGNLSHTDGTDGKTVCGGCICKAIAILKRVESGESCEVRKVGGEWPDVKQWNGRNDEGGYDSEVAFESVPYDSAKTVIEATFPEAAAGWNKGAM